MTKYRTKKTKKTRKYKARGGDVGTSGSSSTFISDIEALIGTVIDTIKNTGELIYDVWEFPSDISKNIPYKQPATPGTDL